MTVKVRSTFFKLGPALFSLWLFSVISLEVGYAEDAKSARVALGDSSGDDEIDQIRADLKSQPTDESNYLYRAGMARLWEAALGHQGAVTGGRFNAVTVNLKSIEAIEDGKERARTLAGIFRRIDEGYRILESIQKGLVS